MKLKQLLIIPILTALLCCCEDTDPTLTSPSEIPLVVEGWIEEGALPIVMVTHAVDLTVDTASFDGFVEKWCRVSVEDTGSGERYFLTGRINNDYTPSFIFTHTRLRGQAGHTYRLMVETDDTVAVAEATLSPAPAIDSLTICKTAGSDSLYSIQAYSSGVESDGDYKFFARAIDTESRYYPTFLGTFHGSDYSASQGWNITRGTRAQYSDDDTTFSHHFRSGERVMVKLCTIDPAVYTFWHSYDSNVSLSANLFFTFTDNCRGNIDGALGYWAAYGTSVRSITIP